MVCTLYHSLLRNDLGEQGANIIIDAVKDKPRITTLCGFKPDQTEANLRHRSLKVGDAILLAFDLKKNSTLIKLE